MDKSTLAIIAIILRRRRRNRIHSRYAKRFYLSLNAEERRRRDRRIPRVALVEPGKSAWRRILVSGNDQSLITITGLDFSVFGELMERFEPMYSQYSVAPVDGKYVKVKDKSGRRRLMKGEDCLGLVLVWTRTRGSLTLLQVVFGMSRTGIENYLRFGILIKLLSRDVNSKIGVPSRSRIEVYKEVIKQRHPALEDVGLSMDGLRLASEAPGSFVVQNNYYNGWKHNHCVASIFVFAPDGTIIFMVTNCAGSQHDSTLADLGGIYEKLRVLYEETGVKCCVDSAFSTKNRPYLIKSAQSPAEDEAHKRFCEQATSMRQSAEWGMRVLQSSFPRMKDKIVMKDTDETRKCIKLFALLSNFRSNCVGINQIRNVYMPWLSLKANEILES